MSSDATGGAAPSAVADLRPWRARADAVVERTVRLLVAARSQDPMVGSVVAGLGRLGLRLQVGRAESGGVLARALAGESWDAVLVPLRDGPMVLADVVRAVEATGEPLPVVGLAPDHDPVATEGAMRVGVRDVVDAARPGHLALVLRRELRALAEHRALVLAERSLRRLEQRTLGLLDASSDPAAIVRGTVILHANPAWGRMFGTRSTDELAGSDLAALVLPHEATRLAAFARGQAGSVKPQRLTLDCRRLDGAVLGAELTFTPIALGGREGQVVVARRRDAPAEAGRSRGLEQLAQWDQLTGLHTARHFLGVLERAVADAVRGKRPGWLLLLELESFRTMRHTVGIVGTDLLVKDLAGLVARIAAEADSVARFGNHTFALLVHEDAVAPGAAPEIMARALGERLRAAVESHISVVGPRSVATTGSVAVLPLDHAGADHVALMEAAEVQCRRAIEAGGNRVVGDGGRQPARRERRSDAAAGVRPVLGGAVDRESLALAFAPVVNLHGGTRESYEVMIAAGDGDTLRTADDLYAAVDDDERASLDRWLIERVVEVAGDTRRRDRDVHLFVRLSDHAVRDESAVLHLTRVLRDTNVDRQRLTFELPEHVAVGEAKPARAFVSALHKLYCSVAIDGFGRVLSSIEALRPLDADFVRLHPDLLRALPTDPGAQSRLQALQAGARRLRKTTVATGVGDAATLMALWQCGVHYVQGDYIRPPAPAMDYDFRETFEY
ncbi:MAG: EAL domain-containing protein [Ectothiorhodospiraceae bacterium]|nr:EAL domain-containing protein [Chromatiales bacterium]MCP5156447.1 EAL domain-containing protein [Ectothiorhodospiraceae bacterium]